jgi:penicillin-binding protein 2
MVTRMAAFESGVLAPEDTVYCPGVTVVSGIRFHCWKKGGHGNVDFHRSLVVSCDCYYYEVGQRAGIEAISAMGQEARHRHPPRVPHVRGAEGIAPTPSGSSGCTTTCGAWATRSTPRSAGLRARHAAPARRHGGAHRHGREVQPRLVKSINGVEQPSGAGAPWASTRTRCGACAPRCSTW